MRFDPRQGFYSDKYLAALAAQGRLASDTWSADTDLAPRTSAVNNVTLGGQGALNPPLPFEVFITQHGGTSFIPGKRLRLLIPPSEFHISSSQQAESHFTREGQLPTLSGSTQPVISLNGSSAAFLVDDYGLASPVDRAKSLGYANFVSLMAQYRSGGYQRLSRAEDLYTSRISASSRVIHVLDAICIYYDGTYYYGHFTTFTMNYSGPFKFDYTMEFTVSGIGGDRVEGHIGDGQNQDSGIVFSKQGTSLVSTTGINKASLQPSTAEVAAFTAGDTGVNVGTSGDAGGAQVILGGRTYSLPSISTVTQAQVDLFQQLLDYAKDIGYTIKEMHYLRTEAEQINDFEEGNSTSFVSLHTVGAAMDIVLLSTDGKTRYTKGSKYKGGTSTKSDWVATTIPTKAHDLGLRWGGSDFGNPAEDYVHFDLAKVFPECVQEAKDLAKAAGEDV
jgi:hypothetical protein